MSDNYRYSDSWESNNFKERELLGHQWYYCQLFLTWSHHGELFKHLLHRFISHWKKVNINEIDSWLLFCIASHICSYRSSNYCNSNSCRYFTFLKVLAKVIVIFMLSPLRARKSNKYCYCDSWKSNNFRKQAIKKKAKNFSNISYIDSSPTEKDKYQGGRGIIL